MRTHLCLIVAVALAMSKGRAQTSAPFPKPSGVRDALPNVWLGMTLKALLRARPNAEGFSLAWPEARRKKPSLSERPNAVLLEKLNNASFSHGVFTFKNKSLRQISLVNNVRDGYDEDRAQAFLAELLKRFGRPDVLAMTPLLPQIRESSPRMPCLLWTTPKMTIWARFSYPPMTEPIRGVKEGLIEVTLAAGAWNSSRREMPFFAKPSAGDEERVLAPLRRTINALQPGPPMRKAVSSWTPTPLPTPERLASPRAFEKPPE